MALQLPYLIFRQFVAWLGPLAHSSGSKNAEILVLCHELAELRRQAGDERERLWAKMVEIYPGYDGYAAKTTRRLPVVVLERA